MKPFCPNCGLQQLRSLPECLDCGHALEMPKLKIDSQGKPFDPAERARKAMAFIRTRYSGAATPSSLDEVNAALNAIADRLQTCDALELKVERLVKAESRLMTAAREAVDQLERGYEVTGGSDDGGIGLAAAENLMAAIVAVDKAKAG